jgi:hypothetical protein
LIRVVTVTFAPDAGGGVGEEDAVGVVACDVAADVAVDVGAGFDVAVALTWIGVAADDTDRPMPSQGRIKRMMSTSTAPRIRAMSRSIPRPPVMVSEMMGVTGAGWGAGWGADAGGTGGGETG